LRGMGENLGDKCTEGPVSGGIAEKDNPAANVYRHAKLAREKTIPPPRKRNRGPEMTRETDTGRNTALQRRGETVAPRNQGGGSAQNRTKT